MRKPLSPLSPGRRATRAGAALVGGPAAFSQAGFMQTRQLRAGSGTLDLTIMGFGGAPLGNLYAPVTEEAARATLDAAWDSGIRVYDTSPLYGFGLSEERFGRFFSGRPRDAFVISTKIGRLLEDCAPEDVPE